MKYNFFTFFIMVFFFNCGDTCDEKFANTYCSYDGIIPGTNIPFPAENDYNHQDWNILLELVNNLFNHEMYCNDNEIINNPEIIGDP